MELWMGILVCGVLALVGMVVLATSIVMITRLWDLWIGGTDGVGSLIGVVAEGKWQGREYPIGCEQAAPF
jgi:hypothetical protein